ncbi:MAG: hypothetical protein J6K21_04900 [Bacilli bacterium]|nr:hypothetical protein [Bacilli bacterium]
MKKIKFLLVTLFIMLTCFTSINYVKADTNSTGNYIGSIENSDKSTTTDIVVCGNLGEPGIPAGIPKLTRGLYNLVKYIVPVAIILLGMLDFVKAVMASKEQDMKEYQNKFIRRLIAGVAIFLVLAIVNFVLRQAKFSDSESMLGCLSCLSTTESACSKYTLSDDGTYIEVEKTYEEKQCMSILKENECNMTSKCTWNSKSISCEYSPNKPSCSVLGVGSCSERSDCKWTGSICEYDYSKVPCSTLSVSSCSERSDCKWTGSQSGGICISKE